MFLQRDSLILFHFSEGKAECGSRGPELEGRDSGKASYGFATRVKYGSALASRLGFCQPALRKNRLKHYRTVKRYCIPSAGSSSKSSGKSATGRICLPRDSSSDSSSSNSSYFLFFKDGIRDSVRTWLELWPHQWCMKWCVRWPSQIDIKLIRLTWLLRQMMQLNWTTFKPRSIFLCHLHKIWSRPGWMLHITQRLEGKKHWRMK